MLSAFWSSVGGRLADRWAAISAPALLFWLTGLAAWSYHRGGLHTLTVQTRWLDRQTGATQIAAIVTVLLAVAASALVVERLTTPVLRLLEGYWPRWTGPLRRRLASWLSDRAAADAPAWQAAHTLVTNTATPTVDQLAMYARLERRRRRRPSAPGYFLPTPIGNILRAAERRPIDKYGLDTVLLWPRLWPALPETTRADLLAARAALNNAVAATLWGILLCAFTPFTPLVIPVGLGLALTTVTAVIPGRAQVFGDLIEAAYDQHRTILYEQTRWPLPTNPHDERERGQALTAYLWRGSDNTTPTFTVAP
ncbi:hypothetical protein ND748_00715 [Frankia sp. AiPs1]|uniref:hypothetical protein n=1 Tax=Frankia sp. AiPs1 TaxID=573493 RepID=UPI002044C229|nr:hypothetical protein [Frankia sp. AiPs1]MCM3920212.1 hypothetical protein [Frankia sp. AiPs1]